MKTVMLKDFAEMHEVSRYKIQSAIDAGKLNHVMVPVSRKVCPRHGKMVAVVMDSKAEQFKPRDLSNRKFITIWRNVENIGALKRKREKIAQIFDDSKLWLNNSFNFELLEDFRKSGQIVYLNSKLELVD